MKTYISIWYEDQGSKKSIDSFIDVIDPKDATEKLQKKMDEYPKVLSGHFILSDCWPKQDERHGSIFCDQSTSLRAPFQRKV